jgi:hypothetical protein
MGLPADWSLSKSLSGKGDPTKLENVPQEGDDVSPKETETPEETLEEGAEETTETPVKPVVKETLEKKPAAKEAPKAKETPAKTAVKPKAKEAPAKAAEKATEVPEAKPDAPAKIKFKGKDYTEEELEALINKKPETPAPVVAKVETAAEPSKEQAEATRQESIKKDREWIAGVAPQLDPVTLDEPALDKILAGGPEAVKAFQSALQSSVAQAVLLARKSMYADLEPRFQQLTAQTEPLISAQAKAEDEKAWTGFATKYPQLADKREFVEQAASYLAEKEADRVRDMSLEQFSDECATRVFSLYKKFGFDLQAPKSEEAGTGGAPAEAPAAKPATPAPVAAKAPVARAKVAPPAANVPEATPGKGGKGKSDDSGIIASLL